MSERPFKAYDGFAKELFTRELSRVGDVDTRGIRVAPEQHIDVRFERKRGGAPRFALLNVLAGEGSLWEPFSRLPSLHQLRDNVEKHLAHNRLTRKSLKERAWDPPGFRLWLLVPFRRDPDHPISEGADLRPFLESLSFTADTVRGSGFYALGSGWNVGLVVLEELPVNDETLWLRLLARGSTLKRAVERLKERILEDHHQDDIQTLQLLVRWGLYGKSMTVDDPWVKEILMHLSTDEAFELAKRKMKEELKAKILEEATPSIIKEAKPSILKEGLNPLFHLYERRLERSLTEDEHNVLLQRLEHLGPERVSDVVLDLESEALAVWLEDPNAT